MVLLQPWHSWDSRSWIACWVSARIPKSSVLPDCQAVGDTEEVNVLLVPAGFIGPAPGRTLDTPRRRAISAPSAGLSCLWPGQGTTAQPVTFEPFKQTCEIGTLWFVGENARVSPPTTTTGEVEELCEDNNCPRTVTVRVFWLWLCKSSGWIILWRNKSETNWALWLDWPSLMTVTN